jgi:hypothetical protein
MIYNEQHKKLNNKATDCSMYRKCGDRIQSIDPGTGCLGTHGICRWETY